MWLPKKNETTLLKIKNGNHHSITNTKSGCLHVPSHPVHCPGHCHWCPDPGLGEEPSGHHLLTHQECGQMLLGVHTGTRGHIHLCPIMSCRYEIHTTWMSLWHFSTLIFSVILVSLDLLFCYVLNKLHDYTKLYVIAAIKIYTYTEKLWNKAQCFLICPSAE